MDDQHLDRLLKERYSPDPPDGLAGAVVRQAQSLQPPEDKPSWFMRLFSLPDMRRDWRPGPALALALCVVVTVPFYTGGFDLLQPAPAVQEVDDVFQDWLMLENDFDPREWL